MRTVTVKAAYQGKLVEQEDVLLLLGGCRVLAIHPSSIYGGFTVDTARGQFELEPSHSLEFFEIKTS